MTPQVSHSTQIEITGSIGIHKSYQPMNVLLLLIAFNFSILCDSVQDKVEPKFDVSDNQSPERCIDVRSEFTFYFRFNKTDLDINYMTNAASMVKLDNVIYGANSHATIDSLKVVVLASPDGKYDYNLSLAQKRALSIKRLLIARYSCLEGCVINSDASVADWSKLGKLIEHDFELPYRSEVVEIINSGRDVGAIGWKLKQVRYGEPWSYIVKKYIRYLRSSDVSIQLKVKDTMPTIAVKQPDIEDTNREDTTLVAVGMDNNTTDFDLLVPATTHTPLFALKTNLLFDALSLVNLEVEVPIGKRWSVAGEAILPWWTWDNGKADSKRNRIQLFNANLEGRYWFGKRADRPMMTGWFAGMYVGGGLYDLEYKAKGYQGEFFIMGGLSGGYAHTINRKGNLRMEYALGIGYLRTDYRYYESHFAPTNVWHPLHNKAGRYSWFGPTKVKVSFVWLLNRWEANDD